MRRLLGLMTLISALLAAADDWTLVWHDEFDGPTLDTTKWSLLTGGNGWGNNESEYYTVRRENAYVEKGVLVIKAIRERYSGPDHVEKPYTSARMQTLGKFEQAYGKFEARIQVPAGNGIWPAFWMLGADIKTARWPGCGEIDIMENIGREPNIVHGTLHGPGYSGDKGITGQYALPEGQRLSGDFHVYNVEWEPDVIRWYIDSHLYHTVSRADLPPNTRWVFDHPFFLLLNVAVGGNWPGPPDESTVFPQTMLVDYVRVYQRRN